jgi:hypothetical protein
MASTLAQNVFQIGFVVPDIHKGMAFFKDKLGVPEFLSIEKLELQDEIYLGKPAPLRLHLAFGWCGETQVELIQSNHWRKHLLEISRPQSARRYASLRHRSSTDTQTPKRSRHSPSI